MTEFESVIIPWKRVVFPEFSGLRIMMMPFEFHNPEGSLPESPWKKTVCHLTSQSGLGGVGYLTIDEAEVRAGEYHRRPGLHVDGVGGWGGGGGGWGSNGMFVAASDDSCVAWPGTYKEAPAPDGNCDHLWNSFCIQGKRLSPEMVYYMSPFCVHMVSPMKQTAKRQFMRLSFPNDCPWFEGYTENPLGVKPGGPILPARAAEMNHRP